MRFAVLAVALLLPMAGCEEGGEGPSLPDNAMGVKIVAEEGAAYDLNCRFRAIQLPGQGPSNNVDLSGTGPRDDAYVPTDNARCTLAQRSGPGPVTVTIAAPSGPVTGTTPGPGAITRFGVP